MGTAEGMALVETEIAVRVGFRLCLEGSGRGESAYQMGPDPVGGIDEILMQSRGLAVEQELSSPHFVATW